MVGLFAVALLLVAAVSGAPDNKGTEFIVGYMANRALNMPVELYVTTTVTTTVYVQITAPRFPSIGLNEQFEITAGSVTRTLISNSIRAVGTALETKGVLVTASDEVVVYGTNIEAYANDAFLAFPLDVLGAEYYAVTHYPSSPMYCEFLIVGVYDTTSITIQYPDQADVSVTYAGTTYGPGDTQTIVLNKYDTYQAQTNGDLTATYITGNRPFALFSGNQLTNINPFTSGGTLDAIVDQMLPVSTWGMDFAIVPTPHRTTGDQVRFLAANDSTTVVIHCSGTYFETFTMNTREYRQYITPSDENCHVTSDKAIMVILFVISQLTGNEPADPAIITIPPIEQYNADYTFSTPQYSQGLYQNYFMFIVKDSEKSGLKLDDQAFPANTVYTAIPNTTYTGGFVKVSHGTHTVRHDSPISLFGGFMYGSARYESYGMPTGLRLAPINTVCVNSTSATGDGFDNDCDGLIDEEICNASPAIDDDGDGLIDEDCARPLPIHGNWSTWGAWGSICYCVSQSATGNQPRRRTCDNPAPQYDGNQCTGSDTSYQSCTPSAACPVDGGYTTWSGWSSCQVTCGEGTVQRTRNCSNPAPADGGRDCTTIGVATLSVGCYSNSTCPVIVQRDGGWGEWGNWTTCSATCNSGNQISIRLCNNPVPMNGLSCQGDALTIGTCNTQTCNGNGSGNGTGGTGSTLNGYSSLTCPNGFFPCQSGSITCIENAFVCDCTSDCSDGSDENTRWGLCTNTVDCHSGAEAVFTRTSFLVALSTLVLSVLVTRM